MCRQLATLTSLKLWDTLAYTGELKLVWSSTLSCTRISFLPIHKCSSTLSCTRISFPSVYSLGSTLSCTRFWFLPVLKCSSIFVVPGFGSYQSYMWFNPKVCQNLVPTNPNIGFTLSCTRIWFLPVHTLGSTLSKTNNIK